MTRNKQPDPIRQQTEDGPRLAEPVEVCPVTEAGDEVLAVLATLLPQLSASTPALSRQALESLLSNAGTTLLVASIGGRIVGTLTLVVFRIPTGIRAFIEDVVVDGSVRRRGVGRALTAVAINLAWARGARTIDLTSRPDRLAANGLYRQLGFKARQTNVYRLTQP